METRRNDSAKRIGQIVKTIVKGAQVYQGGSQAVDGDDISKQLQTAGAASVVRLYRDFDTTDQLGWEKVIDRARKGETQPLQPLKYTADTDQRSSSTGAQIAKRWPVWTLLQDLLAHAKDLGPSKELEEEAKSIRAQRALLGDHDPVQALLAKTVDLLRNSLNHHVEAYRKTFDRETALLEQDSNWQKLKPERCKAILAKHGLNETVSVDVSTPESILDELERCSLSQWADRTQALKGRFEQARLDAVKLLQPKVQQVNLPRHTITDEAELADWLEEAEQLIRDALEEGPVMV